MVKEQSILDKHNTKSQLKYFLSVGSFIYRKNKQKQYTDLEKYGILLYNEGENVKRRKMLWQI